MSDALSLDETLSRFADRLFRTGGTDPGAAALDLPEERLAIYRELVENDYEVMLRFALTQSCKLVTHEIEQRADALGLPPTFDDVVLRHLQVAPSTTTGTREMCERFAAFLPAEYPPLFDARPELTQLIELERAEAHAYYAEDDPGRNPTSDEHQAFATMTVDEFLSKQVLRAPSSTVLRFPRPVVALHGELAQDRFPPSPQERPEVVTVYRLPGSLLARFAAQTAETWSLFEMLERSEVTTVERLAERWLADLPEELAGESEGRQFHFFSLGVVGGLSTGFFRLA